jgi:hypothetical protein
MDFLIRMSNSRYMLFCDACLCGLVLEASHPGTRGRGVGRGLLLSMFIDDL